MSEAVTSSEIPGVAELQSLGWSSTMPILKRASNGTHQAKDTPYAYILKCIIFKQQLQKCINGQCITSEKNTV